MSEIGENLKNLVLKGIEVIGTKANDLASSAKQKVGEFNLTNEQKELFGTIGSKVYELYRQGADLPAELAEELKKAAEIEEELNGIRAEKEAEAKEETGEKVSQDPGVFTSEKDSGIPEAVEYAAKDDSDVPVIEIDEPEENETEIPDCPLSSAINDLFEKMPPVDKMMDKVNSSLDELSDNLRKFSGDFDKQLNEFADQMMGKDDTDHQK